MNYMAEIKAFYDRLELNPLPSPAIALWHALMAIANKTGWQQEFTVAVSVLVLKSGLNAQAIKRARNRLEQDGYITWKSRGGNQSAVYHLNSLVVQNEYKNVPQFVPQNEPQSVPQTVPQCEPQSVPINKHKQNNISVSVNACERFEEFWAVYPKQANRLMAEQAYAQLLLSGIAESALIVAAGNYAATCNALNTKAQYIKQAANWLNKSVWVDFTPENYKKPEEKKPQSKKNSFTNYPQRSYDYAELERQLLNNQ